MADLVLPWPSHLQYVLCSVCPLLSKWSQLLFIDPALITIKENLINILMDYKMVIISVEGDLNDNTVIHFN